MHYLPHILRKLLPLIFAGFALAVLLPAGSVGQVNQVKVLDYDSYGNPTEVQDANGIKAAYDWSEDGTTLIGIFTNAEHEDVFAHSFAYDGLDGWPFVDRYGDSDTEVSVVDGRLKVKNLGGAVGPELDHIYYYHDSEISGKVSWEFDLTIADSDGSDLQINAGGDSWNAYGTNSENAIWSAIKNEEWRTYNGTSWVSLKQGLEIGRTYQFKIVMDSPNNRADYYLNGEEVGSNISFRMSSSGIKKIAFGNYGYGSITTEWYIDNVRMYPESAQAQSLEAHQLYGSPVAIKDASGSTNRFGYDDFGRLDKTINPRGGITKNGYFYSNLTNGAYDTEDPNSVNSIVGTKGYETDFSSSSGWSKYGAYSFNFTKYNQKTVRLGMNGSSWSSIYRSPGEENIYAKVDFATDLAGGYDPYVLALNDGTTGTPNRFAVRYNLGTDRFYIYLRKDGGSWQTVHTFSLPATWGEWYTIEIEKVGEQCTAWVYEKGKGRSSKYSYTTGGFPSSWTPQVRMWSKSNYIYFANFEYIISPQRSIAYLDGLGREIQSQMTGGGETIVSATTYNERGLKEVVSRPFQVDDLNSYLPNPFGASFTPPGPPGGADLIDEYDGTSGGENYPFTYTAYEESPINRPVEVQMPGGSNYTNLTEYGFLNFESFTINGRTWGANTLSGTARLDPDGKVTGTYTDGWGQTIVSGVEWNSDGKLSRSSSDLVTEFAYDLRGNLVKVEDPLGLETTYTYNALGQLVEKELPDQDYSEEYKYDKKGRLRFIQQPNQKAMGVVDISHSLSGEDYVVKTLFVSEPGEIKLDIQVNDLTYGDYEYTVKHYETGQLLVDESFSLPGGSATHTIQVDAGTYKFMGAAVSFEPSVTTSGTYTFRSYKVFSYIKYDELDRVTEEGVYSGSTSFAAADPDSETFPSEDNQENILYYYDGDQAYPGSLTQKNMKGRVSKIEYKDLSAPSSSWGNTWYSYNAQGAVEWVVQDPPGLSEKSIKYEYDELGRMTQMDFQAGVSGEEFYQRYSYDALGRLDKTESSTNGTSWETEADYTSYLADGQVETAYLYGGASNPTALSLSEMLVTSDEEYVAADSIIVSGLNVVEAGGDLTLEAGNYIRLTDGFTAEAGAAVRITANENLVGTDGVGSNIAPVNYTYTVQGWLDMINNPGSIGDDEFALNLAHSYSGNITQQKWVQRGISTDIMTYDYSYDDANRLTLAEFSGTGYSTGHYNVDPTYDKNGNIKFKRGGIDYDYLLEIDIENNSNRIERVSNNYQPWDTLGYDANGNMTKNELQGFTSIDYDWRNLPSQTITGSGTMQYAYDGDGNRVKKEVAGGTEMHYIRGANGETLAIYEDGSLAFHNILSGSEVIGTYDGSQRRYFLKDHLGSVRTTVDQHGNVDSYDDYYPFGLVMPGRSSNTGNPNDNYKFTGYEQDDEAGLKNLYHANARGYDPVLGRFMQIDPAMEYASPYTYVGNNPLSLVDPTGMSSDCPPYSDACPELSSLEQARRAYAAYWARDIRYEDAFILRVPAEGEAGGGCPDPPCDGGGNGNLNDISKQAVAQTAYTGTTFTLSSMGQISGKYLKWQAGRIGPYQLRILGNPEISKTSVTTLSKVGTISGRVLGAGGLAYTYYLYNQGKISKTEFMADSFFGTLSLHPVGSIISLGYFGPKSYYEISTGNKMYPDAIFGNKTPSESFRLLRKYGF